MKKRSSGDFDVLGKDNSMKIGNQEDEGLSLILCSYPIIVVTIVPEGISEVKIRYERLKEQILKIEIPLGIPVSCQFEILASLGIKVKCDNLLVVECPLAITHVILNMLEVQAPLLSKWKIFIEVDRNNDSTIKLETITKLGKTRKRTVKSLQALRKLLRKEE